MVRISTFVFFDLETTGLPYQERNRTKIIELSFVAVTREDIRRNIQGLLPPNCKLSFVLNPLRPVLSTAVTGLDNEMLKYAPTFKQKFNTIKAFLDDLQRPVCLVAHNGNSFDYKILLAECGDANVKLPDHLLCADSITGFKKVLKTKTIINESILTDDEDEWPQLNVTPEEFEEIDGLCASLLNNVSISSNNSKSEEAGNKSFNAGTNAKKRESYKLTDIYRRILNEEPKNAHRAEDDCFMLLQCVRMCQDKTNPTNDFLCWIDDNCKKLDQITALQRK